MNHLSTCVQFYTGCRTNKGQLVGFKENSLVIKTDTEIIENCQIKAVGISLFLYLRSLNDLTNEERLKLIKKGINIGRPKGYTFSPESFLFLLSLHVDVFGLIHLGYAKELNAV